MQYDTYQLPQSIMRQMPGDLSEMYIAGKIDQVYWEFVSTLQVQPDIANILTFFQSARGVTGPDLFTNMMAPGRFPKGHTFIIFGVTQRFINSDGQPFDFSEAGQASLRAMINTGLTTLKIDNKDYIELPIVNIVNWPQVAILGAAGVVGAGVSISHQRDTLVYDMPVPFIINEERSFSWRSEGSPLSLDTPFGFTVNTNLQTTMHGMLLRPVQ